MLFDIRWRREADRNLPVLVWQWSAPMRSIATSPHSGGLGLRRWVINAQVPPAYSRRDPEHHLAKLAVSLGLAGRGNGMLTETDVRDYRSSVDEGVEVVATVDVGTPILASTRGREPSSSTIGTIGTINVVAVLPERLSDAALVNALVTASQAKGQALLGAGVAAAGTATDAVCVICPNEGRMADFGDPGSRWGARLARAVHAAVLSGVTR